MKLSPQGQIDIQSQAKILVTIAVVANLLLALVLSLMILIRPSQEDDVPEADARAYVEETGWASHAYAREMRMLPAPKDW